MTTPINPGGFAGLARGRGFGERPGPLIAVIVFLPLSIALLCAATVVLFNDRWIAIVFEGLERDLWAGVWIFLILGIASLATVVSIIASAIKISKYASNMPNSTVHMGSGESGFGRRSGPVVTVVILVILSSAVLSASLTQWLVSKAYGLENGVFKGVWGGVYVFFALSLVCLGIAIAVSASTTRRSGYLLPNPANYQFQSSSEQSNFQQPPVAEVSENIEDEKLGDAGDMSS